MIITEKPILQTLAKLTASRVPIWLMRQAGRYLPEYREVRASKGGFMAMALDPDAASEVTMQPIRRFGLDAAIIFSDILMIPYGLGQGVDFVAGEGPSLPPIRTSEAFRALSVLRLHEKLDPVYQALGKTKEMLTNEGFHDTALIGFAGAPWTVLTYMIEGGGSKDFIHTKTLAYTQPDLFADMLELVTEATAAYLIAQAEAGAEVLKLFDSWAGAVDADHFARFIMRPAQKIVEAVRSVYPDIPIIAFPRGVGVHARDYALQVRPTALALDSLTPTNWAAQALQPLATLQGNMDPMILLAGGDAMYASAERILTDLYGAPFIFNLGHGINKNTPPEHVKALVDFVRGFNADVRNVV